MINKLVDSGYTDIGCILSKLRKTLFSNLLIIRDSANRVRKVRAIDKAPSAIPSSRSILKRVTGIALIILLSLTALQAQTSQKLSSHAQKGNGKVNGVLLDSTSQMPVPYATVALINLPSNKPVDGTISDEEGKFEITKIPNGDYALEYSFAGYRTFRSRSFEVKKGSEINFGNILIAPEARMLKEVTILGMEDLIEEKVDRLIYNAEKEITAKTKTKVRSPILSQRSVTGMYNAGIRLNFTCRIGQMSFDGKARKKKSIKNDDVKSEASEGGNTTGTGPTQRQ